MREQHDRIRSKHVSLLYVSTSLLPSGEETAGLADIVTVARARNRALSVTGALVLARNHFAQVLEGPRAAIDQLMASIRQDPRHTQMNVVDLSDIGERRFPDWSLAYTGPSTYVDQRIVPLLANLQEVQSRRAAVHRLLTVIQEFVGSASGAEGMHVARR